MFKVCSKCDFEWHEKDGAECPVCKKSLEPNYGKFGSNHLLNFNTETNKPWVQALAIITLIVLVYLWMAAG